jgi:hypothetical protein
MLYFSLSQHDWPPLGQRQNRRTGPGPPAAPAGAESQVRRRGCAPSVAVPRPFVFRVGWFWKKGVVVGWVRWGGARLLLFLESLGRRSWVWEWGRRVSEFLFVWHAQWFGACSWSVSKGTLLFIGCKRSIFFRIRPSSCADSAVLLFFSIFSEGMRVCEDH